MSRIKDLLRKNLSNIPGWRTKRKIVVIESDDWGSVRIRDKEAFKALKQKGLNVDEKPFDYLDTLESDSDLSALFEVLYNVKDSQGNPAKFTPMCIMGNPDFEIIEGTNFTEYHFQPLHKTLGEYPKSQNLLILWNEGQKNQVFIPELHGREHVNVYRYLEILKNHPGKEGLREAVKFKSIGPSSYKGLRYPNYLGALHPTLKKEIPFMREYLHEAASLFEAYLNRRSAVFVAPNAEEPRELEETLKQIGVKYINRSKRRVFPRGDGEFQNEWNYIGKQNEQGQIILTRNAFFEPCQDHVSMQVEDCLKDIEIAFKWNKPAVISSHRVNYVGGISPANRDEGLKSLQNLLSSILNKWPDVEFMTSAELGDVIKESKNA